MVPRIYFQMLSSCSNVQLVSKKQAVITIFSDTINTHRLKRLFSFFYGLHGYVLTEKGSLKNHTFSLLVVLCLQ